MMTRSLLALSLCFLLPVEGCSVLSDEYGVCEPERRIDADRPQPFLFPRDAFASAINPPAAVVCYPEGATTPTNRDDEMNVTGLAITNDPDATSVFSAESEGTSTPFSISACLDLDFCELGVHDTIRLTVNTEWGSDVCGSENPFEIPDCRCASGCDEEACGAIDDGTVDKVYFFVSANGRDFEYVRAVSPTVPGDARAGAGRDGSIIVNTAERAYRFVRICRPARGPNEPHTLINNVRVGGA